MGYDQGTGPYQFGSPQGLVDRVSCGGFVSEDQPRINEVAIGHHVLGFGSEVLNVAIIALRDEAWSRDCDRFELVSNRFGSALLGSFGQKISDRKKPSGNLAG